MKQRRVYSPIKKQQALELYMEGSSLPAIAHGLGVNYHTLHNWHTAERWSSIKSQLRSEILEEWRQNITNMMRVKAVEGLARNLMACNSLLAQIEARLNSKESLEPKDMLTLAKALQAEFKGLERGAMPVLGVGVG